MDTITNQMRATIMESQSQKQEKYEDSMLDLTLFEVTTKLQVV
jgi:hypothetical protein